MSVPARDGHKPPLFLTLLRAALPAVAIALPLSAPQADPRPGHWFEIYAAERGVPLSAFKWKLAMGPFESPGYCHGLGALGLEMLNAQNPDRDFMGRCTGDDRLLTLQELADMAERELESQR